MKPPVTIPTPGNPYPGFFFAWIGSFHIKARAISFTAINKNSCVYKTVNVWSINIIIPNYYMHCKTLYRRESTLKNLKKAMQLKPIFSYSASQKIEGSYHVHYMETRPLWSASRNIGKIELPLKDTKPVPARVAAEPRRSYPGHGPDIRRRWTSWSTRPGHHSLGPHQARHLGSAKK